MKIYLTTTSVQAKYSMLYTSVYQIFSKENAFEIIDVCNDADCIVSVGDITNEIVECKQKYKKAVVRFLFRSDISQYFYTDVTQVDYTFWVCDLDINILCPYQQTSEKIAVPFDFSLTNDRKCDSTPEFDIYVNTGEFLYADSALFKILRTLNRLTHLRIDVCSKNESIKHLANANIHLSDSSSDIENHVRRAQMVIGSGYAVLFAIKHHKPFIVVGERGYGGIPTSNNIVQFYHDFFQGTIGGRFDGALPEKLVYEDIINIQNNMEMIDFTSSLSGYLFGIKIGLIKQVNFIISRGHLMADAGEFRFNTDYTIVQGNGKCWLLNRFTRFIERKLNPVELEVLKGYISARGVVCTHSQDKIEELQYKKILLSK
ncbi:hypothetical protein [Sodaliphilus pleomorphus]|uniref:Uncharacterized protein n=1 Tax=Sodaliphilus pleomorphus TaxID=2606626 RepID=A0A6L5XCM8_9BACT|nr:hypothetical protein [Sodaliphilus pleomorphus]MSS17377.1 hypothetical protein [Sodaliphilus pleomorphus]